MHQARVQQLGSYLVDLQHLESANLVDTAQLVLRNLCAKQERSLEEVEKEIAERTVI